MIAEEFEPAVGERTEANAIKGFGPAEKCCERFDDFIVLGIDIHLELRPCREKLFEEGNRSNPIDPSLRDLGPRKL